MIHIDVVTVRKKNCESILNRGRNNESKNMKTSLRLIRTLANSLSYFYFKTCTI